MDIKLKEEINITRDLLRKLADEAWKSFRGNYGFYNYFVNAKFDRLEFIEEKMEQGILSQEEKEQYLNEIVNIHNMLKSYEGKELKDKIISDSVKSSDDKEMKLNDNEIDELLSSLDDNKLETSYPTEDFDEEFIPLDLPDIPGDNPIQPGDIEKSVNLPR